MRKKSKWGKVNPRHDECKATDHRRHTVNAYSNLSCRCPGCREAWRRYKKAARDRRD